MWERLIQHPPRDGARTRRNEIDRQRGIASGTVSQPARGEGAAASLTAVIAAHCRFCREWRHVLQSRGYSTMLTVRDRHGRTGLLGWIGDRTARTAMLNKQAAYA